MVSTFKLLAVLQLALTVTVFATSHVNLLSRQGKPGPPLRRTNNNTWLIGNAELNHPGSALEQRADNVGGIRFMLRRSVWNKDIRARTMTFVPVTEDKSVYCTNRMPEQITTNEWRQCSGYHIENAPPGDEDMTDELNRRLKFRLSKLKTSSSGKFESVTMEIVNHAVPTKYALSDIYNLPGARDRVPMVAVFLAKVVYEASAAKCSLRDPDYAAGKGWETCYFDARTSPVQEETITEVAFERKYWKLGETSSRNSCD